MLRDEVIKSIKEYTAKITFENDCEKSKITNLADRVTSKVKNLNLTDRDTVAMIGRNDWLSIEIDLACIVSGAKLLVFPEHYNDKDMEQFIPINSISEIKESGYTITRLLVEDERVHDRDVLTLVFSSGTTGKEKGLIISSEGTSNAIKTFIEHFSISSEDRYYTFLPFSYYQQRVLIYTCILTNSEIYIGDRKHFIEQMQNFRPTWLVMPPAFWKGLLYYSEKIPSSMRATMIASMFGELRFGITAMAPISESNLIRIYDLGINIIQTYAVTECGIVCWNTPDDNCLGSVGRPLHDNALSLDEKGIAYINRSPLIAIGYFEGEEDGVYVGDSTVCTGDILEKTKEGYYKIVGRSKDAVVLPTGKKLHPSKVESIFDDINLGEGVIAITYSTETHQLTLNYFASKVDSSTLDLISDSALKANDQLNDLCYINYVNLYDIKATVENGVVTRNGKTDRRGIARIIEEKSPVSSVLL